jgi:hypothetical protein
MLSYFFSFPPINILPLHHIHMSPLPVCSTVLIRKHIITSEVFKFGTSPQIQPLIGYTVMKLSNFQKCKDIQEKANSDMTSSRACISIHPPIHPWLYRPFCWTLAAFQFLELLQSVGLLGRGSARRKAATCTQNKSTHTSMPQVGFEPTIPVFERVKTVHALEGAATVIGPQHIYQ